MTEPGNEQILKGQRNCGIGIMAIGVIHTAAHFLIPQPRQAVAEILKSGLFNTLGTDWAAANFSTLMSLVVGFFIIMTGILVYQTARIPWKIPLSSAVVMLLIFLFIVIAGPNGGGWLA
ncbi:MAG: hypothetical protein JXA42_16045, partial [Anaerolineales bacterium]|nr:hypothetical protein [Anaerolineales bacterium]